MFPDPCGEELQWRILHGDDPSAVVPDDYSVVKGGTIPLPSPGEIFSCTVGPTIEAAASALPFGQLRHSTAAAIRRAGGIVIWLAEKSRHHTINLQHVNVIEAGEFTFSDLRPNPVPKSRRIDGDK